MELRHLRYFLALAEELHFGRAAQRLSMSQPPLSVAIQQLEASVGARLFLRNSKSVQLTAAGQALVPEARALLAQRPVPTQPIELAQLAGEPLALVSRDVSQGMGVALVPEALQRSGLAGAFFVPLTQATPPYETRCLWRAQREGGTHTALAAFLEAVRGHRYSES